MAVLIAGASGIVGRCLSQILHNNGIKHVVTYNTRKIANGYKINMENEGELNAFLKTNNIKICVNCVVQRQVNFCETNWNEIKKINVDSVDKLSKQCECLGIYLIHLSTDYVFDGSNTPNCPYYPHSNTNPIQNYGKSKLIAEKCVIANMLSGKYTIIRVPVLYTAHYEQLSETAVTLICKKVLNSVEEVKEDDLSIRRPVYVNDFCYFIMSFIKNQCHGIYHFYNPIDKTTKYEIAKKISNYLGKDMSHIIPDKSADMTRPYDTELKDDKHDIYQYFKTNLEEGIKLCFSKWKHPDIIHCNDESIFIMMDLDGTLLDTDVIHYNAYADALKLHNINLTYQEYEKIINMSSIDDFILSNELEYDKIKEKKTQYILETNEIKFVDGAETFLKSLLNNKINFVIVTNTSSRVIAHYKRCIPILNKIQKWICREDYIIPKPNSEAYATALHKYYKNEKYTIGFENTWNGYQSIKNMVQNVYFVTNKKSFIYNTIKNEDIYIIKDYNHFGKYNVT